MQGAWIAHSKIKSCQASPWLREYSSICLNPVNVPALNGHNIKTMCYSSGLTLGNQEDFTWQASEKKAPPPAKPNLMHSQNDVDPGQQDPLWLLYSNTHTHGLQKSCGEKGAAWLLAKLKRGPLTRAWTGFYCFLGTLHEGDPHLLCRGSP